MEEPGLVKGGEQAWLSRQQRGEPGLWVGAHPFTRAGNVLDSPRLLGGTPPTVTGSHLLSTLGQQDGPGLGQPCNEKLDLGFFFAAAPYALPQHMHQQLVADCFFRQKADFQAFCVTP